MQGLSATNLNFAAIITMSVISTTCLADTSQIPTKDTLPDSQVELVKEIEVPIETRLALQLPSQGKNDSKLSKDDTLEYLSKNPEEFERILGNLLIQGNATMLRELIPVYKQVPNYDPSVIDWGNAIILAYDGKLDESIRLYRQINAKLPNVNILRFQMAMALYYNRQFEAAESEFEKLRSDTTSDADVKVINQYLDAIREHNRWDINASLSYLNDDNITNSPKPGTTFTNEYGNSTTYTSPREEGEGFSYYASADKRWNYDDKSFTALHLNSYGKYYWDNKDYNDLTLGAGVGVGYDNGFTEVELIPFLNKRLYAQGSSGDGTLKSYNQSIGAKLQLGQWLSPNIKYQGLLRYSDISYIDKYNHNDATDYLLANTMIFMPDGQKFWTLGVDYATKDAFDDSSSYTRTGMRLGWGQTWQNGYSSKLNLGYAQREYNAEDFFGIKRDNEEFNAGLSLWKRDFTLLGLTPRLQLDYDKVTSNSPFEEYDKYNVSVELSKTF